MNRDLLDALMALMAEQGIEELDHTENGVRVHLKRMEHSGAQAGRSVAIAPAQPAPPVLASDEISPEVALNPGPAQVEIAAPMVGVFYLASAPDAPPFVREGDVAREGDTLYILEVMKTLNRVVAEFPCRIVRIVAGNGETVETGTPLFVVERLHDTDV
ncbi:MAG: biotin/lipoyl-containing protein [Acetobacter sp.]|uniref:acetyl-CoA carboxylase biotin carboxyl carrier protein n=1 Tax=Acetobacter sp. TaxID=440 RepID=UPI0039E79F89